VPHANATGKSLLNTAHEEHAAALASNSDAGQALKQMQKERDAADAEIRQAQGRYDQLRNRTSVRVALCVSASLKRLAAIAAAGIACFVLANLLSGGWASVFGAMGHAAFGLLTAIPKLAKAIAAVITWAWTPFPTYARS
jgi:hypothetical protein